MLSFRAGRRRNPIQNGDVWTSSGSGPDPVWGRYPQKQHIAEQQLQSAGDVSLNNLYNSHLYLKASLFVFCIQIHD